MPSNLSTPAADWLDEMFEFERCAECQGDTPHHTAIPFLGNWFARCDFAPDDEGNPHPVIAKFLCEEAI